MCHWVLWFSDGDGIIDMLLPVCKSDDCSESFVYVYSSGKVGTYALDPDKRGWKQKVIW